MKKIYKIARTELQTLFYSPVAWFILIVFVFQMVMLFMGAYFPQVYAQEAGYAVNALTLKIFSSTDGGILPVVQSYLYLYIPLLTMGLMSRELGSGSIKLLYASPVTNTQIILGKYLSMMIFGLIMFIILAIFFIFGVCTIQNFDYPPVLVGLLGLYLLFCAYSAIGLFMSSLTSYQIVAAILTLTMFSLLSYVSGWWQDIEFVRDITYWLAISGRAGEFVSGLLCSEDLLYFVIVSALFLSLTIIRLESCRQKKRWTIMLGKYVGVLFLACSLGYLSSRPSLMTYYDATKVKRNTLTENSQKVIAQMKGGLTITSYSNALDHGMLWVTPPKNVKNDQRFFRQYIRFKPEIKMKYVYYYDTVNDPNLDKQFPDLNMRQRAMKLAESWGVDSTLFITPEEIRTRIDLSSEGNRYVRVLERENGEKSFLRMFHDPKKYPNEAEITAAFKRLVMQLPKVGFLTGHRERSISVIGDRGYNFAWEKTSRYALINQGFDVEEVTLDREIPEDINILVIGEMRDDMTEEQSKNLEKYVDRGGNLFILSEPRRSEQMESLMAEFGVKQIPGTLVRPTKNYPADLILVQPTREASSMIYHWENIVAFGQSITMPSVAGLEFTPVKGFRMTPLFVTDSLVWNELETTDFVDDIPTLDSQKGEIQQSYVTSMALSRQINGREQKVVVFGDADCISNGELGIRRGGIRAVNFYVIMGCFYWLSDEEVPIDVRRPASPDRAVFLTLDSLAIWKVIMMWVIPGLMVIFAFVLWFRRRGR